jgi:hypothetical protein
VVWWRLFSEDVRHRAVAEGLIVIVGVQVVFIVFQWRHVLDLQLLCVH